MKFLNSAASVIAKPDNWIYAILVGFLVAACSGAFAQDGSVRKQSGVAVGAAAR